MVVASAIKDDEYAFSLVLLLGVLPNEAKYSCETHSLAGCRLES